jgi:hypothetical protein
MTKPKHKEVKEVPVKDRVDALEARVAVLEGKVVNLPPAPPPVPAAQGTMMEDDDTP